MTMRKGPAGSKKITELAAMKPDQKMSTPTSTMLSIAFSPRTTKTVSASKMTNTMMPRK